MKRIASVLLVITLIVCFVSLGYAQTPQAKLGRGLINTLTGFWELPLNTIRSCKNEGMPKGLTIGLTRGLALGLYRTLVGLYEVVTFAIPAPADYKAITNPPILITSESLEEENPTMRKDFRPLSTEYEGKTSKKK